MWRLETYLAAVVQHGPHVGGPKTKWRGVTMQIWIITAVYYNNGHRVWHLFPVSIVILHIVLVRLRNPMRIFLRMWRGPIYLAAAAVNTNFVHRDARPIMGVGRGGVGLGGRLRLVEGDSYIIAMSRKGVHLCLMNHKYQEKVFIFVWWKNTNET